MSKSTRNKNHRLLGLTRQKNEMVTRARAMACSDARNFLSMAIMANVLGRDVLPDLLINFDDTQVKVERDSAKYVLKFSKADYKRWGVKDGRLRVPGNEPLTDFFIKIRVICSRAGNVGDWAIFVANDNLDRDSYRKISIRAFAGTRNLHIYFVAKRGQIPEAANRDWILSVLIPFLDGIKEMLSLNAAPSAVFVDGENGAVFQGMRELLNEKGIRVGKIPASTTGELQPLDTSSIFKLLKRADLGISDDDMNVLSSGFKGLLSKGLSEDEWVSKNVPTKTIQELVSRLSVLKAVIETKISAQTVMKGWKLSGWSNKCEDNDKVTFKEMLGYCWGVPVKNEINRAMEERVNLEAMFSRKGLIRERDFDNLNLYLEEPQKQFKRGQDKWVLRRQRAIDLLHPHVLNQWPPNGHEKTVDDASDSSSDSNSEEVQENVTVPLRKRYKRLTEAETVIKSVRATGASLMGLAKSFLSSSRM